jgi:hypothetical protein
MNIKISGLDAIKRQLDQLQLALKQLNGKVGTLSFDPHDPESIRKAIAEMERLVDGKIAPYRTNPVVSDIAANMKKQYRKSIIERAQKAVGTR